MRINALLLMLALLLAPAPSDARCRTVGESASLATEYGTFPLYPAFRLVEIGHERDSIPLQMIGYGLSAPLFVVARRSPCSAQVLAPRFIRGPSASTLRKRRR
jgi:hypothetical protein